MTEDSLKEISKKLDTVIRLLAIDVTKGRDEKEKVRLLNQAGLAPKDIAGLLGKTPNSVRVMLFKIRKSPLSEATDEVEANDSG